MKRGLVVIAGAFALLVIWWLLEPDDSRADRRGSGPVRAGGRGGPAPTAVEQRATREALRRVKRRIGEAIAWLDVIVVSPSDEPRAGVPVWLTKPGSSDPIDRGFTDDDGRIRFDPRPGEGVFALMVDPGEGFPAFRAETWDADLLRFDPVRVALPDAVEFQLQVTIDGRPGIPRGFRLHSPKVLDPVFDAARGEVRGRVHPRAFGPIDADAPDLLVTHRSVHRCSHEVCEADLGFSRRIRVTLRILGEPEFAGDLVVERRRAGGAWEEPPGSLDVDFDGDDGTPVLTRELPTGRFRVATRFGIGLREFELLPGSPDTELEIDLRNASWAEPKVVVPAGIDLHGSRVEWRVVELDRSEVASRRILHPGDRPLTFEVDTPLLEPDPARGQLRTDRGGRFELVARAAALVRFRYGAPTRKRVLSIQLIRDGRPTRGYMVATRVGDEFCFSAPPPGRYDLVVWHLDSKEGNDFAPTVARGVLLDGATDLGTLRAPERGCELTVAVRNPPRRAPLHVSAERRDPKLVLPMSGGVWSMFHGGARAQSTPSGWIFRSVPRGPLTLRVTAGEREWTREIECDGTTNRTIEFDLGKP